MAKTLGIDSLTRVLRQTASAVRLHCRGLTIYSTAFIQARWSQLRFRFQVATSDRSLCQVNSARRGSGCTYQVPTGAPVSATLVLSIEMHPGALAQRVVVNIEDRANCPSLIALVASGKIPRRWDSQVVETLKNCRAISLGSTRIVIPVVVGLSAIRQLTRRLVEISGGLAVLSAKYYFPVLGISGPNPRHIGPKYLAVSPLTPLSHSRMGCRWS